MTQDTAPINGVVLAASFVAAVTFAVMIGAFYLLEQYLQGSGHYSALAASAVLVVVATLVAVAAPMAGRLADARGDRLTALLGFLLAGLGLALLGTPGMPLDGAVGFVLLAPLGIGLGMLFVPTSRAGLNGAPQSSHGRVSAILSLGRLLGAMIGASAAGAAISGGASANTTHQALLVACGACVVVGLPVVWRLGTRVQSSSWPLRLSSGRRQRGLESKQCVGLPATADVELGEEVAQVPLNGPRAQ